MLIKKRDSKTTAVTMEIEGNSILEKHNELEPSDEDPYSYVDNIYYRSDFTKDEENYVLGAWPKVKSFLEDHGVSCELHLAEGFMTIAIARTVEQDIFDKARVALDLLPSDLAPWAIKLLNARQYEIIKIGYEDDGLSAKFGIDERECDERKELLLGPDDIYIKPLEELTGCFVIVNWNTDTVIARGLFEGLKLVRMIVEECIVCKIPAVDIISKIRTRGAGALLW
ncbi:KRR1 small subunit processome component-like isoform X1 [Malus sylvestris]|uniref:KRR1 small subunit processome component-like isoform X1 n=1 Tax=Malus sylvestris TaxID=3752 RepID=UPI0021AD0F66|nr:KRR1 small subunit processome component-like isoform X1 [Malus sylvestris]